MRNIFRIFKHDLRALYKNFFAFLIILAILILPALYAWFNIYAFWDPYGKTKDVSIAVVSNDKDYMDSDGNIVNMGKALIEEIKALCFSTTPTRRSRISMPASITQQLSSSLTLHIICTTS